MTSGPANWAPYPALSTRAATATSLVGSKAISQLLAVPADDVGRPGLGVDGRAEAYVGRRPGGDHGPHQLFEVGVGGHSGRALAVTCLVPAVRIGCLNEPFSTVAATEAIASGDATSCPSPHVSWASSAPEAVAGTFHVRPGDVAAEADVPLLVEAVVVLRGRPPACRTGPTVELVERVVAGLREVGDERGPGRLDSFWLLRQVIPWTLYVGGQLTGDCGLLRIPVLNSAVEVMTLSEEPGATAAVSAKSLKLSLLAIARMSPVDGWMTTIELIACSATALRAALSADELIVVASDAEVHRGGDDRLAVGHRLVGVLPGRVLDLDVETGLDLGGPRRAGACRARCWSARRRCRC